MIKEPQGEIVICTESDIISVRKVIREFVVKLKFGITDVTRIVTAASELARNTFLYAGEGIMRWSLIQNNGITGVELVFVDRGPGITDIDTAFQEGYSTSGGLGMGLPGTKRLMDEMDIE